MPVLKNMILTVTSMIWKKYTNLTVSKILQDLPQASHLKPRGTHLFFNNEVASIFIFPRISSLLYDKKWFLHTILHSL